MKEIDFNNESIKYAITELKRRIGEDATIMSSFDDKFETGCNLCGKCCRDRNDILLTVYDVRNIRKGLNMPFKELVLQYIDMYLGSDSKLPVLSVKFRNERDGRHRTVCPFLRQVRGKYLCKVNDFKPNLCRLFPVGKVTIAPENTALYVAGKTECLPKEEQFMTSLRDWVGGEELQDINSRWSNAFVKKDTMLKESFDGIESAMVKDPELLFLAACYIYDTNVNLNEDEAIKEYLNPESENNKLLSHYIEDRMNK